MHLEIDSTFSDYSSFETEFDNKNYMNRMKDANSIVVQTKSKMDPILPFELDLVNALLFSLTYPIEKN